MGTEKQERSHTEKQAPRRKSAMDHWQSMMGFFSIAGERGRNYSKTDVPGAVLANLQFSAMLMERLFQNIPPPSDAMVKFMQISGREWAESHRQWLEKVAGLSACSDACSIPGDGNRFLDAWSAFYEKEVQPLLNIPQVGLGRFYQERANCLMDKFHSFQRAAARLLKMMSLPMDESLRMLRKETGGIDEVFKISESLKNAYEVWIKNLEGLYQDLFRSSDFVQCLSNTVNALEDFVNARMEYVQDMAKAFQLPTMKDLDEAYRELYLLKKEVKGMKGSK